MGFENRKSLRVKLEAPVCFWLGEAEEGQSLWGHALNLSATGMALHSAQAVAKGELVALEVSLPEQKRAVHLKAKVIYCQREGGDDQPYQLRLTFTDVGSEERQQLRQYVLLVAEPGMGWGRAYFPGQAAIDLKYRELAASDKAQWLQAKAFLSMKEIVYLKGFQGFLEKTLGQRAPESLKLLGSRPLKDGCDAWLELDLPQGQLHFLAKVLWCQDEPDGRSESGLSLVAFHKEEALYLEKKP